MWIICSGLSDCCEVYKGFGMQCASTQEVEPVRVKPGAPTQAQGLSPVRSGLASWSAGCMVMGKSSRKAQRLSGTACSLGPLGIYEATVPPGGCVVLPKGQHPVLQALGLPLCVLERGLLSSFYRRGLDKAIQLPTRSRVRPQTWVCPAPRPPLSSQPEAAEGSHRD